jgi:hypothetical protein
MARIQRKRPDMVGSFTTTVSTGRVRFASRQLRVKLVQKERRAHTIPVFVDPDRLIVE